MIDFQNELFTHAARYEPRIKGTTCWIKCPFHGNGMERTPSCCINLVKGKYPVGFFYCFGCGKHGSWNELADKISGLTRMDEQEIKHQDLITTRLTSAQRAALYGNEMEESIDFKVMIDWDKKESWRGINGQTLFDLGAKLFYNKQWKLNQIFLPAYQNGELKGGIKGALKKMPNSPSYINTAGPWVKKTLFPYDFVRKMPRAKNYIAIVEGPRDALNLIQYGMPALAILGSKNWSEMKYSMFSLLNPKLTVLALDNDEAGQSAFETIYADFEDSADTIKMQFREGGDPGELTEEQVKKYIKKFDSFF